MSRIEFVHRTGLQRLQMRLDEARLELRLGDVTLTKLRIVPRGRDRAKKGPIREEIGRS